MAIGTYIAFLVFVAVMCVTATCDESVGYRNVYYVCMSDPSRTPAQCHTRAEEVVCHAHKK